MAVIPWRDEIKNRKVLNVFPTDKVKADNAWLLAFTDAIAEFNRLSASLKLGVTFVSPPGAKRPDPVRDDGTVVVFDLGKGRLSYEALGQTFVVTDKNNNPIDFSATDIHGYTEKLIQGGGIRRAIIFVPTTPMVTARMKAGPGKSTDVQRLAGPGIRRYIAVHEMIHALGVSDAEHNATGPDADTFTINPDVSAGAFDKPEDDKFLLRVSAPNPPVTAPPNFIKKKVADLIRANWQ